MSTDRSASRRTPSAAGALTNWAGNHTFRAAALHQPESLEQLQELVRRLPRLKVIGSRHSFNDIADSPGDLVTLGGMPQTLTLDPREATVTVNGAMRYGDLAVPLEQAGLALHNLASLPHITIAGACATATHGSGDRNGNLATAVSAMEVVTADGEIARFSRALDAEQLRGAIVSLGGLGVVTRLTLDVRPTYQMRQDVYEDLPFAEVEERFDDLMSSADSVSLFTTWSGPTFEQAWFKRRVTDADAADPPREVIGATLATRPLHPIPGLSPTPATEQLGVAGPWYERLPHFRIDHAPTNGDELQSEYMIPRRHAFAALSSLSSLRPEFAPLVQVSEVRTIAADDLWMSTSYRQDSVAIHFTWQPDWPAVSRILPLIEARLSPFDARPHWGKLFTIPPDTLGVLYPRLADFRELLRLYDPGGKFRNVFLDRYVFDAC